MQDLLQPQSTSMVSGVALHKTSAGWEFANEAALEQFVWNHITELFGLTPLKRQYISNGEICDILAIGPNRQLTILELKNTEDRYLIQQLTRYYANFLEEKPFQTNIDYSHPVRLIAIAPTYHRHNLIDARFSKLDFDLLQFLVKQETEEFYLLLQTLTQEVVQKYRIPYEPIELPVLANVPNPPDLLMKWLGGCTKAEQEGFLRLRSKLLSCSQRMKETVERSSIQYGSGKTKLCAEICFQPKRQKPVLFLWLPTPSTYRSFRWRNATSSDLDAAKKPAIGRLRIWTDGTTISHVGHVPESFGRMRLESEWNQLPPEKRPKGLIWNMSSRSHTPTEVEGYLGYQQNEEKPNFWDVLTNLAIETWLDRT